MMPLITVPLPLLFPLNIQLQHSHIPLHHLFNATVNMMNLASFALHLSWIHLDDVLLTALPPPALPHPPPLNPQHLTKPRKYDLAGATSIHYHLLRIIRNLPLFFLFATSATCLLLPPHPLSMSLLTQQSHPCFAQKIHLQSSTAVTIPSLPAWAHPLFLIIITSNALTSTVLALLPMKIIPACLLKPAPFEIFSAMPLLPTPSPYILLPTLKLFKNSDLARTPPMALNTTLQIILLAPLT